jgi:hypothetical protein
MRSTEMQPDVHLKWSSDEAKIITFTSRDGSATGVVKEVRWGLVWRDFILEDGRVIPEHKILGEHESPVWRKPQDISQDEREACERRLASMADAGLDPRDEEQSFRAELNQYLAYTYLRFKEARHKPPDLSGDENSRDPK